MGGIGIYVTRHTPVNDRWGKVQKNGSSKQFSSLATLHASRPTAICSDVMAVCSVQIEITESGDRLKNHSASKRACLGRSSVGQQEPIEYRLTALI